MKSILVRGLEEKTYRQLKSKAEDIGVSVNKLVLQCIDQILGTKKHQEFNDLNEFFGSWSENEYRKFTRALEDQEQIDEELWK